MAGIFKAYDIRGIYGEALTDEMAYKIGRAVATYLKPKTIVIGHDMRPHSKPLFEQLSRGLVESGVDVINLGLCSTPMNYFANGHLKADASVIITASHNPGPWNGFKICRANAVPLSGVSGIGDIERLVEEESFDPPAEQPGTVTDYDILPEYIERIRSFSKISRPLKVAIDYANAMGIVEGKVLDGLFAASPLFDELDGSFPNHEANPLDFDTYVDLQNHMKGQDFDFGIAFDGDADRVGFTDENGEIVSMDMITALIACAMLEEEKGIVFYDLRSSWAVKEVIAEHGGEPRMSRVGHAFIKNQIREANAIFAGELSGHYYFRENYFTESSALAVVLIANLVSESGKTLSELVAPIKRYHASGEINSRIPEGRDIFAVMKAQYPDGRITELDGLTLEFDSWWFNVRMSNTEPLCRLNLEAKTLDEMISRRDEVLNLIRG